MDSLYPNGYYGWPNKETLLAAALLVRHPHKQQAAKAAQNGATALRNYVEDRLRLCESVGTLPAPVADLVRAALARVDWEEVRDAIVGEIAAAEV